MSSSVQRKSISPVVVAGVTQAYDLVAVAVAGRLAYQIYNVWISGEVDNFSRYAVVTALGALLFVTAVRNANGYEPARLIEGKSRFRLPLIAGMGVFAVLIAAAFMLKLSSYYSRGWATQWMLLTVLFLVFGRLVLKSAVARWRRSGQLARTIAIVGAKPNIELLLEKMRSSQPSDARVIGVFAAAGEELPTLGDRICTVGPAEALVDFARDQAVDEIVIALPLSSTRHIGRLVDELRSLPADIRLNIDPGVKDFPIVGVEVTGGTYMLKISERPLSHWNGAIKRLEDILLAGLAVILLAPLYVIVALAIKLDSSGPVLFEQERTGFNNKPLKILKFRTMHVRASDPSGVNRTVRDDPRVTRIGRILRRFSLDELPQFFNVLRGDMSIVGPRPHVPGMLVGDSPYSAEANYLVRHRVKPGITGWAQVNGLRGEIREYEKARERVAYDLYYIDHWSFGFDIFIMFKTCWTILKQEGAY